MRQILLFLLSLCFFKYVAAQQPSQSDVQAQMKQAKAEAREQIIQMEADIAEAKKNGESLENIAEMEKNLATMKKMLGVIDKAASIKERGPRNIEGVNSVPTYKSPYVRFYEQPVVAPTEAQAKDKLLWYRGKKINQNTLVTTRGRVIQYDRQNNRVLVQYNERKDSNQLKIINNLGRSRQWNQNYVNRKSGEKNSFFDYPLVMMVMKEFDLIEKQFDKLANNSLDLPGSGTNPRAEIFFESPSGNSGPSANYQFAVPDSVDPYIQQEYEEIMSRVNNPPSEDVYPPPKQEYSLCHYCDESAQEKYYRDVEIWSDGFHEFEARIISGCLSIYRYYALMIGADIYENIMDPQMLIDLKRAERFAEERMERKISVLKQRYENDIFRISSVISTVLGWERQKALLGVSGNELSYEFVIFTNGAFKNYMKQRIAANDYDVIFNYAMILGFARNGALLGNVLENYLQDLIIDIVNHNRFVLTMDLDFDLEMGEGEQSILKANGTISTKDKVYVRLGRNKDCKWQFYLFDADYSLMTQENVYKLPLVVNGGTKMVKKGQAWQSYPYSGPADLLMPFPSFRMSFCQTTQQDSALLEILRYEQEDLSGFDAAENYTVDLLAYVNKIIVSITDTKANTSGITDLADEMMSIAGSPTNITPTGYGKLDKMQAEFKGNGQQHDIQQRLTNMSKVDQTVMLFDAQNGSQILINNTTNSANSEFSIHVKKGTIKLKVVNEPL